MTTLETILIIYILLSWVLMMMFAILPKRFADKVSFIFIIICPPLIIGVIFDMIISSVKKRKNIKEEELKDNE